MKKKKILRTKNAGNLITNNRKQYIKHQFDSDFSNFLNSGNHTHDEMYEFLIQEVMKISNAPIEDAIKVTNEILRKWSIYKQQTI